MAFAGAGNGRFNFEKKLKFPFSFQMQKFKRKNQTYIMPTGFGLVFGTMCFVLLFLALGYQNNVIYAFTFFTISIGLTSMWFTNSNIRSITFEAVTTSQYFAKEAGSVFVNLKNNSNIESQKMFCKVKDSIGEQSFAVAPYQTHVVQIQWSPPARGLQKLPRISFQSSYPFGLLRSWKQYDLRPEVIVYPERKGNPSLPLQEALHSKQNDEILFKDHREFQQGDSLNRIDWKVSNRTQTLHVRVFEGNEDNTAVHLNWSQTEPLKNFETRLSQLALWIDNAEKQGIPYSLTIGDIMFEAGSGSAHWNACLSYLAKLKTEDLRGSS